MSTESVLADLDHWLKARPPNPYETSTHLMKIARAEILRLRDMQRTHYEMGYEHARTDAIIACENRYAFACAEAIRALSSQEAQNRCDGQ